MASEAETTYILQYQHCRRRCVADIGRRLISCSLGLSPHLAGTFSTNTTENGGVKRRWQWRTLAINIVG